ncbi:Coiled-coil domain containing protein 109, C-terminal, partial [Cynara cardunculus var. scolymus]
MALRRTLAKHLIKDQTPTNTALNAAKSYFHRKPLMLPEKSSTAIEAGGFFRRFLQRRKINQSSTLNLPELFFLPIGETLREKLKISGGERLRLDDLRNPTVSANSFGISVNDARKIMRSSQLQKVRSALKQIPTNSITYSEFLTVCIDICTNHEQGLEFSKTLDQAGDVIILGNVVFLRPDQLAKSMEKVILQTMAIPNDPRKQQLEELEQQKAFIDKQSLSQVRGELYCGLGFLIIQTLAFMRLTFWELSWDVMEPICFFVTSFHFALAYMFFLRTSKEPTFEGYFQRRFKTKQRKLMKVHNFDLQKYNELREAFYPANPNRFVVSSGYQDSGHGGSSDT